MLIFESKNFTILTPEQPHVSRGDGGHLIINPKTVVEDRTHLSRELAIELMKLTMVAGAAMKTVLTQRGYPAGKGRARQVTDKDFDKFDLVRIGEILALVLTALALAFFVLRETAAGRHVYAVGNNAEATRLVDICLDAGVTVFDSADVYSEGAAEEIVGDALHGRSIRPYIVSKVYPHNASRAGTIAACERSLKRMRLERIDLYLLHWRGGARITGGSARSLSLEAVRHVLKLAHAGLQTELLLANVQEPASLYEMVVAHDPDVIDEVSEGAAMHVLAPAISLAESAGVSFEAVVARGDPGHALLELIERHGCDAVVMGAHGKGMVRQALLGSVTMEMLHAAPVPVTLVKPSEATALDSDFETEDVAEDGPN